LGKVLSDFFITREKLSLGLWAEGEREREREMSEERLRGGCKEVKEFDYLEYNW